MALDLMNLQPSVISRDLKGKFVCIYSIPKAEGYESINSCSDNLDNDYDGKIDKHDSACKDID